jgi:hypothetical protein
VHESLAEGVPVVYYNPHNEIMHYDFEFNPDFLILAKDKKELRKYSSFLYNKNISGSKVKSYLAVHCLPVETEPVSTINSLLARNNFRDVRFRFSDLLHLIIYHPSVRNPALMVRKVLSGLFKPEN